MKIDIKESERMFKVAGVNRKQLFNALTIMAQPPYKLLKGKLEKQWSPDNPSRNWCYVVSEWFLNFKAPKGSAAYSLVVPGDDAKHYFIRLPDGPIVDLTAEQFDDYSKIDYEKEKKTHFMYPSPSKRARILQSFMAPHPNENC